MEDNIRTDRGLFGVTEDYLESPLSLDRRFIKSPLSTFFFTMEGKAMYPLLNEGDVLIVERGINLRNGQVVVGCYQGELVCRQFSIIQKKMFLTPINNKFHTIPIDEENFELWGVVRSMVREFL